MTQLIKITDIAAFAIDSTGKIVGIIACNGKRSDFVTVDYDPVSKLPVGMVGGDATVKSSIHGSYTVATLPAGTIGMRSMVTDATTPTFMGTLTGGGAVKTPVVHNGTAWIVG